MYSAHPPVSGRFGLICAMAVRVMAQHAGADELRCFVGFFSLPDRADQRKLDQSKVAI